jgi:ATP-dependent DNA ligase
MAKMGILAASRNSILYTRPKLIAQVSLTEWTNYGLLRHAPFEGLRGDKNRAQIVREV